MTFDEYLTISEPGFAQMRVLGSRFLGSAFPAHNDDEIARHLRAERKRCHDATHCCFGARFGVDTRVTERASDGVEPKGTAGTPILREIQGRDLTDTLVIVTRYFGGTKLGTGNLARAYGECAAQSLDNAVAVLKTILSNLIVECPYDLQAIVYHLAHKFHAAVEPDHSDSLAVFRLAVPIAAVEQLTASLHEQSRGQMVIHLTKPWN